MDFRKLKPDGRLFAVAEALRKYDGNVTKAANMLRIHRTQLSQFISRHMAALGLVCPHCKSRMKVPVMPLPPVSPPGSPTGVAA